MIICPECKLLSMVCRQAWCEYTYCYLNFLILKLAEICSKFLPDYLTTEDSRKTFRKFPSFFIYCGNGSSNSNSIYISLAAQLSSFYHWETIFCPVPVEPPQDNIRAESRNIPPHVWRMFRPEWAILWKPHGTLAVSPVISYLDLIGQLATGGSCRLANFMFNQVHYW